MKFEMIIGIALVLFHAIHTATGSLIDRLIAQFFAFEKTMNPMKQIPIEMTENQPADGTNLRLHGIFGAAYPKI